MFGLFKKRKKDNKPSVQFVDLNGIGLKEGDKVFSHRYELGECLIVTGENGFEYESISSKKRVNWTLMIDAATDRQKVEVIE